MRVSLDLALFSANSRVLMSFRRALYLVICSQMITSTHLEDVEEAREYIKTVNKSYKCCQQYNLQNAK